MLLIERLRGSPPMLLDWWKDAEVMLMEDLKPFRHRSRGQIVEESEDSSLLVARKGKTKVGWKDIAEREKRVGSLDVGL